MAFPSLKTEYYSCGKNKAMYNGIIPVAQLQYMSQAHVLKQASVILSI
jgi:hypothetical protein